MKSLSCVQLLATPWTEAYQAPPSMGFARQEYWSGVPLPSLQTFYLFLVIWTLEINFLSYSQVSHWKSRRRMVIHIRVDCWENVMGQHTLKHKKMFRRELTQQRWSLEGLVCRAGPWLVSGSLALKHPVKWSNLCPALCKLWVQAMWLCEHLLSFWESWILVAVARQSVCVTSP